MKFKIIAMLHRIHNFYRKYRDRLVESEYVVIIVFAYISFIIGMLAGHILGVSHPYRLIIVVIMTIFGWLWSKR
jgi:hypothetical protein